jgi:hypothetical protein
MKRLLFSNYSSWKHCPPLCHLDRSAAQWRDLCVETPFWKCLDKLFIDVISKVRTQCLR